MNPEANAVYKITKKAFGKYKLDTQNWNALLQCERKLLKFQTSWYLGGNR
jgi:hypothetical protein